MGDNRPVTDALQPPPHPASALAAAFGDQPARPRSDDQPRLDRIRAAFAAPGYTVDGVERRLGAEPAAALHRDLLAPPSSRSATRATRSPR